MTGSIVGSSGFLFLFLGGSLISGIGLAIAYFLVFYAYILFSYSCQALNNSFIKRNVRFEGVLVLGFLFLALVIWLGFSGATPWVCLSAAISTNIFALRVVFALKRTIANAYLKIFICLFSLAVFMSLLSLPLLYIYRDVDFYAHIAIADNFILLSTGVFSCLLQFTYLAMRISEVANNPLRLSSHTPTASFVVEVGNGPSPKLVFASKRFCELLGISKANSVPQFSGMIATIHPEEQEMFLATANLAFQERKGFIWEGRGSVNQKNYWFRIESNPVVGSGGLVHHQGVVIDISAQKISENELQALQQETQQILKELPIPLIWSSLKEDGITLFVNTRFTEVFGYTLSDIPKTEDWMIRAYPDRSYRSVVLAWWRTKVAQAIKYKSSIPSRELKMLTKDGKMLDVLMRATIVEGLLSVSFLDITDRKMAEGLALTLTENIPVGTYVMEVKSDGSSRLNFVSKRFIQLFGIQASAAKANPNLVFEKIHPEDYEEFMALHTKALREKKRFYQEVRVSIRNKVHWFSFEAIPRTVLDDLMLWEGVTADITDRKEAERLATQQAIDIYSAQQELLRLKQVEELNASLKKTIEEKNLLLKSSTTVFKANSMGNMMRSVAHEINNPLGAISLNTELLELEIQALQEQLPENTRQRMDDLVKAILSDGKRAGSVVTRLRKLFVYGEDNYAIFNLSDLIVDITHILQNELIEHDITLNTEIVSHCDMYGDNGQIQMVVLNALNNAIYAIKELPVPKVINLRLSQTDALICIECLDSGPGFPADFIKKGPGIFQTSKKEGMGVGLWLSKTIIENHHGTLEIKNAENGGAMLLIYLPHAKVMQNKLNHDQ